MKFYITLSYKNSYCNFYIENMKNYYSLLPSSKKAKNEQRTTIIVVFHLGTVFEIDLNFSEPIPELSYHLTVLTRVY